ncbi:MAG: adenosylcobinamide-GDP ribazoletransferase, partial [Paludibacter sp.]|nr:adenosylcobinamide-GDP ribazoletransferase [Paludibacter sp.]
LIDIPVENYAKIICFWPLTGWITGGITAVVWLGFSMIFPPIVAIILAFVIRILLTGGFHEDGLGDFFDGFGGGKTKSDILRIMKDSHVGSYALIGMIFYYLLLINTLLALPKETIAVVIFVADPVAKLLTATMMNFLPYARTERESKSKTLYDKLTPTRLLFASFFGLLPLCLLLNQTLWLSVIAPICVTFFMFIYVKKKIGGYTGDICGATALLSELSFYLSIYLIISKL